MKIEATIKTVTFYNEESSFAILQLLSDGKQITAKGICPDLKIIDSTEKAKGLSCIIEGNWVKHPKFGDPQKLSLIEIVGDSMEPTFKSGDIILVNHNQNYLD
ncbi:MAG: S24 family peptidase, partial [Desulfurella sp.]|uniref:S24 family peptidase n=1 Tax=Desulfurella sp. TaxID=1962857 RepID=UPI003D144741